MTRVYQRKLAEKYGLTLSEYELLLTQQQFVCAICKQPEWRKTGNLSVDHCHDTNTVRGLLCGDCNTALGLMHDSEIILQSALAYISHHKTQPPQPIVSFKLGNLPKPPASKETKEKMSRNHWTRTRKIVHPMLGKTHTTQSKSLMVHNRAKFQWTALAPSGEHYSFLVLSIFTREHNLDNTVILNHIGQIIPAPVNRGVIVSQNRKNTTGWIFHRALRE